MMAQAGVETGESDYLTDGIVDGWSAPALRGADSVVSKWSAEELKLYLTTGRNAHSGVTGEMALVVDKSLQHMTDADADAMAAYLRKIDGKEEPLPASVIYNRERARRETEKMLTEASPTMPLGARLYLDNCSACHFVTGRGAPEVFPALQDESVVTADTPKGLRDAFGVPGWIAAEVTAVGPNGADLALIDGAESSAHIGLSGMKWALGPKLPKDLLKSGDIILVEKESSTDYRLRQLPQVSSGPTQMRRLQCQQVE